jgi:hypothetical protein
MLRIFRALTESTMGSTLGPPAMSSYLPMDTPNSFRPLTSRPFWNLTDGSGLNVPRKRGSEVIAVGGKLNTRMYWEVIKQYAMWMSRINSAQNSPWVTTEPATDYASQTIDFGYTFDDNSWKRYRYLGCKPGATVRFDSNNDPANPFLTFDADILGTKPIPNVYTPDVAIDPAAFPIPTPNQVPIDPLTFQESTFIAYGTPLPYYDRFSIAINSRSKAYYDNGRFPNRVRMRGRTVTLTVHPLLQVATDARARYEAVMALGAMSINFTKGVQSLTFDFRSQSFFDNVAEDMILDEDAYVEWTATAILDGTTGDDFTITYSGP